jgi:hypothetical protein
MKQIKTIKKAILTLTTNLIILTGIAQQNELTISSDSKTYKLGLQDAKGVWVVKPQYMEMYGPSAEGFYNVKDEKGMWGFIDSKGKVIIPFKYFFAYGFLGGLAPVKNEQELYGLIDKAGKVVVKHQYQSFYPYTEDDEAATATKTLHLAIVQKNGKWGWIDEKGKEVIPCEYDSEGTPFQANENGIYTTIMYKSEKEIALDRNGKCISGCK